MENERVLIAMDKQSFKDVLSEMFNHNEPGTIQPDLEGERMTRDQVASFTKSTLPTVKRNIDKGIFKEYGVGRKRYFLKNQIIEALRSNL